VVPVQLVVVDNCSSDDSVALLRGSFPEVLVIENATNVGYARGNNIGARHLLHFGFDFLGFVNPDVTISPDGLASLLETLAKRPAAGCAGGVPLTSGKPAVVARNRPSVLQKIVVYGPLHNIQALKGFRDEHWLHSRELTDSAEVYAVCGACVTFRAEAFRDVGGFDENTFLYEEEFIMAEQLHEKGWTVLVCKDATYQHVGGGSASKMPYRRMLHFYASEYYLLTRYYRWNPAFCAVLRLYRYVEWVLSVPFWWIRRRLLPHYRLSTSPQR